NLGARSSIYLEEFLLLRAVVSCSFPISYIYLNCDALHKQQQAVQNVDSLGIMESILVPLVNA
ncbi:hypothetical protein, partial [Geobacillus sp. AYS3]